MKAIFIGNKNFKAIGLDEQLFDENFVMLMDEYKILESHVIYFSAGDAKIKEIMLCKEPAYSA